MNVINFSSTGHRRACAMTSHLSTKTLKLLKGF